MIPLLSFLPALWIGVAVCLILYSRFGHRWILLFLAPGLGMGFSSVLFFVWSLVFYPRFLPWLYLLVEILAPAALLVVLWRAGKLTVVIPDCRLQRISLKTIGPLKALLGLAFIGACAIFVDRFIQTTAQNPLGQWDAWGLWNLHARYIYAGDAQTWRATFSTHVNHADYPFLLAGSIARGWVLLGNADLLVPAINAGLFTLAVTGLLVAAVAHFRGLSQGLLAGTVILSLNTFLWSGASQYADILIAFYFLGAVVCIFIYSQSERHSPAALAAAGAMCGLALWTKNEGNSFLLATALTLVGSQVLERVPVRKAFTNLLPFALALLPFLLLAFGHRFWLASANDLVSSLEAGGLSKAFDPGRYAIIAKGSFDQFLSWGGWKIPFFPALVIYAWIAGRRSILPGELKGIWLMAGMVGLTFAQYMLVYLFTPYDLVFHMNSSYGRLICQLLPGFLLVVFLLLRNPLDRAASS